MKEFLELAKTMALCKAYEMTDSCRTCGLPATRTEDYHGDAYCDECPPPVHMHKFGGHTIVNGLGEKRIVPVTEEPCRVGDLPRAKAVRRLMRIAKGE